LKICAGKTRKERETGFAEQRRSGGYTGKGGLTRRAKTDSRNMWIEKKGVKKWHGKIPCEVTICSPLKKKKEGCLKTGKKEVNVHVLMPKKKGKGRKVGRRPAGGKSTQNRSSRCGKVGE